MGKKVITFGLSERDIGRAIRDLEQYKKDILRKTELLRKRVAERVKELAQSGFNGAIVDDIVSLNGSPVQADVEVSVDERGSVSVVVASGEDAVWVEFGAGVYYNGTAGSSPHPHGAENNFIIGGYGKGHGKQRAWYFKDDETQEVFKTRGTPAKMPMSNAMTVVCNEIMQIAKEVFS